MSEVSEAEAIVAARRCRIRKEARLLLKKALDSLLLAVEHFNRPWDRGRSAAVLILLDHAFEMLLKAAILHRGGRIREPRAKQTIGFDQCVRRALSNTEVVFLSGDDAMSLQMINGLRDAAQHHLHHATEDLLYLNAQTSVTLFDQILNRVFGRRLADELPERALPLSTRPPRDLDLLVADEVSAIRDLLGPSKRRRVEARSRVRTLAIMEGTTQGELTQPSDRELNRVLARIDKKEPWHAIFPGVAALRLSTEGEGLTFTLRITKKEGAAIHIVPEGTPGATTVAVRRVDELSYYSLSLKDVTAKVGLSQPRALAIIHHLRIQEDPEYFKVFCIGKVTHKRYSPKAVYRIKEALPGLDLDEVWQEEKRRQHAPRGGS